jgi:hypothetical protein
VFASRSHCLRIAFELPSLCLCILIAFTARSHHVPSACSLHSLCIRIAFALHSHRVRIAFASRSLCFRFASALLPLCFRFASALHSLYIRIAFVSRSLCFRFASALHSHRFHTSHRFFIAFVSHRVAFALLRIALAFAFLSISFLFRRFRAFALAFASSICLRLRLRSHRFAFASASLICSVSNVAHSLCVLLSSLQPFILLSSLRCLNRREVAFCLLCIRLVISSQSLRNCCESTAQLLHNRVDIAAKSNFVPYTIDLESVRVLSEITKQSL